MDYIKHIHTLLQSVAGRQQRFGASVHGFRLAPPMPAADIARIEAAIGARLPQDYRDFIATVGAYGAGPGYGLVPLDHPAQWGLPARSAFAMPETCVITSTDGSKATGHSNFTPNREGMILLSDHGCCKLSLLVVHGEDAGAVYTDLDCIDDGLVRSHASFGEWYAAWLADVAEGRESPYPGDPDRCATPKALSDFLRAYAERSFGNPDYPMNQAQIGAAFGEIRPGGIAAATGAGRFFGKQRVRHCASCMLMLQSFAEDGMLAPAAVDAGLGSLPEQMVADAPVHDVPDCAISMVDDYVHLVREASAGNLMEALSRRGLSFQDYGSIAAAWGEALARDADLMVRFARLVANDRLE